MKKIKAAVIRGKKNIVIEELELEDPRADEILVRIVSAGICRTDLEVLDGYLPLVPYPVVLGHEGAGIVEKVGANVVGIVPGDTVILGVSACGICPHCRNGELPYCENHVPMNFIGQRMDGSTALLDQKKSKVHSHFFYQSSWATYALAHQSNAIKVSGEIDPYFLGPFGCGIQTGAGSILNVLDVQAGTSVAVFGLGAVGLSGIMAAKVAGAAVIVAIDRHDEKLNLALEVGATHVINSEKENVIERIHEITGRSQGVNYSLEATGATAVMRMAVDVLTETGHAAITGVAAGKTFELDVWTVLRGRTIHGTTLGDAVPAVFLPRLVELYKQGRFPVEKMMTHYAFEDIKTAIQDVEDGKVAKAVLHPVLK